MTVESFEPLAKGKSLTLKSARDKGARARVFDFTRRCFHTHYDADIEDDSPVVIGAFDGSGALVAAFGLRDGRSGCFCEHYLQEPLVDLIGRHYGRPVSRRHIVEVTHLCAVRPGFLRELAPLLPGMLVDRGYRYLVCTATRCLARYFGRHGIPSVTLATATREALPEVQRTRWGGYYAAEPRVLAGDLQVAAMALGLASLEPTGS